MGEWKWTEAEYQEDKTIASWQKEELVQVKVEMGAEKTVGSKAVKCLGVMLDDELKWKEQVQNVWRKCFTGLAI